jgi:hypothetical protein
MVKNKGFFGTLRPLRRNFASFAVKLPQSGIFKLLNCEIFKYFQVFWVAGGSGNKINTEKKIFK